MRVRRVSKWLAALILLPFGSMQAQENDDRRYYVQPGDILEVSVWREEDLQRDVLVRPDSRFSFPLVGDIDASNKTVEELKDEVVQRLERYIPEPVVTVTVKDILGNKIYLLGQVNNPGAFVVNPRVDVMQALSLAGGTTPFASLNDIVILRRNMDGSQRAMKFQYKDIERGRDLEQNILLESGDIVIVP
ncbi:MAG: polysaccharide export protein [Woeseia sp.]|jgi:polysaccharide biosynthesis/export protein|nr:polysaccharide export protein [Woeseia sp.]